jgi:prepilin-type N-terminal cleavage/methylation domain-containing protein/prepilin-type processing-associated H-X9-DG protein
VRRKPQKGFTLVEVLVVIAVIGILLALLLPAINASREAVRRTQCATNLRQLGIAMHQYQEVYRRFPGFVNSTGGKANRMASWPILLFPYIEEDNLWSIWNSAAAPPANASPFPPIHLLVCPSDAPDDNALGNLSYVANCGIAILAPQGPMPDAKGQATADGVFFIRYEPKSFFVSPSVIWSVSFRHIQDGLGQTLMLSENIQAGEYSSAEYFSPPAPDLPTAVRLVSDAQLLTGFVYDWDPAATNLAPDDPRRINGDKYYGPCAPVTSYHYSRPSSFHPGGVNAAMCDGSVIWLRETIEYKVYQQLMTSDGSNSNMHGPKSDPSAPINYVLKPDDYL